MGSGDASKKGRGSQRFIPHIQPVDALYSMQAEISPPSGKNDHETAEYS